MIRITSNTQNTGGKDHFHYYEIKIKKSVRSVQETRLLPTAVGTVRHTQFQHAQC